jgi:hypothetical protein
MTDLLLELCAFFWLCVQHSLASASPLGAKKRDVKLDEAREAPKLLSE